GASIRQQCALRDRDAEERHAGYLRAIGCDEFQPAGGIREIEFSAERLCVQPTDAAFYLPGGLLHRIGAVVGDLTNVAVGRDLLTAPCGERRMDSRSLQDNKKTPPSTCVKRRGRNREEAKRRGKRIISGFGRLSGSLRSRGNHPLVVEHSSLANCL